MAKHRRSLLDAFRAVPGAPVEPARKTASEAVRAVPQRTAARADAAIPVRVAAPAPPAARRAGTHADVPSPSPPLPRQRVLFLGLLGLTIVVVLVLVLNHAKSGISAAGDAGSANGTARDARTGAQPVAAPAPEPKAAPSLDPKAGYTDDDRAFFDPRNRFTVRLAEYTKDQSGERLAREAYKYLLGEGVPVVQPIQSVDGARLFLCAGAKPAKDELGVLHEWVKALRGPPGRKFPFASAYVDNISHVK